MKQIWTIFLMLALAQASFGEPPDSLWSRTFGGSNDDRCFSVRQTADGGYILAGYTWSFGAGLDDIYLVKVDGLGDTLWTRTFGGTNSDNAYSVQQTTEGGYILGGSTNSFGTGGNPDMWLLKADADGNPLWNRTFGGSGGEYCRSILQSSDGGYILAGVVCGYAYPDFYLLKTDASGNQLWSRTFGGNLDDWCNCVQQTSDGGYILAGSTDSFGAGSDFYLVKTDTSGNQLWSRTFGGNSSDICYSVQETSDGGYILAGSTSSFGAGTPYYPNFYLIKADANGNQVWSRTFGGNFSEECYCVQQTSDGGYILGGYTGSFGAGGGDFWLVKTNANGDSLWSRTFGGSDGDWAYSVRQTTDGGYIVAGGTRSFGAGNADFYLVKTGPEYPNVGYVTLVSPGPPDWGYSLHHVSGSLSHLAFTNFCSGTIGSVGGNAEAAGWTVANYSDSIVFTTSTPLTSGAIDTFWLSHPYCSDYVTWTAGDSSGMIEGPLPVELTTFEAFAGDGQVTVRWRTESELDNDRFLLYKRKAGEEDFRVLAEIPGHGTTTEPHDYAYEDRFVQNGFTYEYQISDVDITGRETIHEQIISATPSRSIAPVDFALYPNYPNPFNPTTTIRYDVKETGLVSLKVFDLLGREVATLVNGKILAGSHAIVWDATGLPSGVYLCRMEAERFVETRKMVLLK